MDTRTGSEIYVVLYEDIHFRPCSVRMLTSLNRQTMMTELVSFLLNDKVSGHTLTVTLQTRNYIVSSYANGTICYITAQLSS